MTIKICDLKAGMTTTEGVVEQVWMAHTQFGRRKVRYYYFKMVGQEASGNGHGPGRTFELV